MENTDFNLYDDEEMSTKKVSSFIEVETSTAREEIISEIRNSQIGDLEVDKSYLTNRNLGEEENMQQVLEIESETVECSHAELTYDMIPDKGSRKGVAFGITHELDDHGNTSLDKKEVSNMKEVYKSKLPSDVAKLLKNMLDTGNKEVPVPCEEKPVKKQKIIVAKIPTNALKQMVGSKYNGAQVNEIGNFLSDCSSNITKLPSNLAESLRNIILKKASSHIDSKNDQVRSKMPSNIPTTLDATRTETIKSCAQNSNKVEDKADLNENAQLLLHCPCKIYVSKYVSNWMFRTHKLDYLEKDNTLDHGEQILLSSKKCLLITLPYSPGFEDEKSTNTQIIAEESGTLSSFEFTESCSMENEFNKIFHYFSCPNLSNTSHREIVIQYIFQAMKELLTNFPVQDSLKLTCNCSLCWFLYVRGKIFSTYYHEENLKYTHSPLASYRIMAIRNIEITDLKPKHQSQYFLEKHHYFLPIRFKRGGKKRDLTKQTALCNSFSPYLNGDKHIKRSKEAEINEQLSKYYTLSSTFKDSRNDYAYINNDGDCEEEQFLNLSKTVTSRSVEPITSVKSVTCLCMPSGYHSSLNSSVRNKNYGVNPAEISGYSLKPVMSPVSTNNSPSKSTFTLKCYGPAADKSSKESKSTGIDSSVVSQILSVKNENNHNNSVVSCHLNESKSLETSDETISNCSPVKTPNSSDHPDSSTVTSTCVPLAKYSSWISSIGNEKCSKISKPLVYPRSSNISSKKSKTTLNPSQQSRCTDIASVSATSQILSVENMHDSSVVSCCLNKYKPSQTSDKTVSNYSPMETLKNDELPDKLEDELLTVGLPYLHISNQSEKRTSSYSSEVSTSGSSDKLNTSTEASVPPKNIDSEIQIFSELDDISNVPPVQSISCRPIPVIPSRNVDSKSNSLIASDSLYSNITDNAKTSHILKTEGCVKSFQSLTDSTCSDFEDKFGVTLSSCSSEKLKKQAETSRFQESKECHKLVSSVAESFTKSLKHKLESYDLSESPPCKVKKQIKMSHAQESKESFIPSSSLIELHKSDKHEVKSDSACNNLKEEIGSLCFEDLKDCVKPASLITETAVKCNFDSRVSRTNNQTQIETLQVPKLRTYSKKLSKKTTECGGTSKLVSNNTNIVNFTISAQPNLDFSRTINTVNLSSVSLCSVSNPALGVQDIKLPDSYLPDSLPTTFVPVPSNVGYVNTISSDVQTPRTIKVVQVPKTKVDLPKLVCGPMKVQNPSAGVNVEESNTNTVQNPMSGPLKSVTVSAIQDISTTNQKIPGTANCATSTKNSKNISYCSEKHNVFNIEICNDGKVIIGGFRGFSD